MPIRDELFSIRGSSELPCKLRTLYDRCRPYVANGSGHFLMYVFGRFGLVRSCMAWIYSRKASKVLLNSGPSLIEQVDVDNAVAEIRRDGFFCGLNLRREVLEDFLTISSRATCFGDGTSILLFVTAPETSPDHRPHRRSDSARITTRCVVSLCFGLLHPTNNYSL
jgi:hypothetical protein